MYKIILQYGASKQGYRDLHKITRLFMEIRNTYACFNLKFAIPLNNVHGTEPFKFAYLMPWRQTLDMLNISK